MKKDNSILLSWSCILCCDSRVLRPFITSTPMSHIRAVFLTFFSPFLLHTHVTSPPTTAPTPPLVTVHSTQSLVLLTKNTLLFYQRFYKDSKCFSPVGAESPPHTGLSSAHIPVALSDSRSSYQNALVEPQKRGGACRGHVWTWVDQILLKNKQYLLQCNKLKVVFLNTFFLN